MKKHLPTIFRIVIELIMLYFCFKETGVVTALVLFGLVMNVEMQCLINKDNKKGDTK